MFVVITDTYNLLTLLIITDIMPMIPFLIPRKSVTNGERVKTM